MTKVLIVVFDALRPEFLRADLMPNLHAFAARGVRFKNSRSTFPTETRVNQTAVLTGCYPRNHGIVGNRFPEPAIAPGEVVNTGVDEQIANAFARAPGGLIKMPTMGERLTEAGRSFAALSAGTPGGGRLINHMAEAHGTFRLAMRCPEAARPAGALEEIIARIGPMPDYKLPATDWIAWAANAYLDYVVPEISPDVMLLWLCEPDESFHFLGIGEPGSLDTMKSADAQFGRILDAHKGEIESGALHIIAMSDHGQISLAGEPLDLPARLSEAGFGAAKTPGPETDFAVVVGNAGGIWASESAKPKVPELVEWLMQQTWCGPLFTPDGACGTLKNAEICANHPRAPDINLILRSSDEPNAWAAAGTTLHDAPYPVGGGCHGGLSAHELNNVLVLGGAQFRTGGALEAPAGNIDVLPTVLKLLNLPIPTGIDGRPLHKAFEAAPTDHTTIQEHTMTAPNGQTHLSVTDYGSQRYLNKAWVS
ncbi:MAG: hypothetical protein HKN05_19135 [Rhizobiales bacterium]|nr:hypothetical protein [Hyphomicrobiales bacterium]